MRSRLMLAILALSSLASAAGNRVPVSKLLEEMVHRSTLAEPGGRPFYLKATITDKDDPKSEFTGTIEEYWVSPTKWRRVIRLRDFSQTRLVNGDLIYEENSGDYFPATDEMLINEIIDPLPKSAVDLMNQLGLMGAEPGSGMGQCMAEKYFNGEDGRETRVLLAYDCKTGLLFYLWSPTCCYGVMTDYRKFHNKMVAYATKDNPINIHIDALRDLDNPDEPLFSISQPTPPEKRITTEKLGESKARNLIVQEADIQWPSTNWKAKEKSMTVDLVIGRDGRVKEARTYSPIDNSIEDAVLTAVKQWTFRPQSVDSVPAQVETSLTIPFPERLLASASGQPEIKTLFEKIRSVGDLRLEDTPGFHMKASFHSDDGVASGTYEETWLSPKKWRREVKLNDTSLIEVQTEDSFYRSFPGKYAPRLADDVIDALSFALPGDNGGDFHEADWNSTNTKLGNVPVLRLSAGYISPEGKPDTFTRVFFIEDTKGLLRARYHDSTLTVFNDLQPFGSKIIARNVTLLGSVVKRIQIGIDTIESAANVRDDLFRIPGVKPLYTEDDEDRRFTPARAVYTPSPSIPGWHGKAECDLKVDEHGHVRQVDVKGSTDESAVNAIRAALMQWEYAPATMNGHPIIAFEKVNVQ